MKKIYLLTKNEGKLLAAKSVFKDLGIELCILNKEYPEIQADRSVEIAKYTALMAARKNKKIVIREDHSLFINALGGFPGPYLAHFEHNMPAEKLLVMMKDLADRTGYFELAAVIAWPDGSTKEYSYRVPIIISKKLLGERGNWNRVLMLPGANKSLGQSTEEENVDVWNNNFKNIAIDLSKTKK
jgi:XTP/dITP diphosphohydrolase